MDALKNISKKFSYLRDVVAHLYHLPKNMATLQKKTDTTTQHLNENKEQLEKLVEHSVETKEALSIKASKIAEMKSVINHLDSKLQPNASNATPTEERFADDHALDQFYIQFEDKFRGSETEIIEKLAIYPGLYKKLDIDFTKKPIIDIGCGRGELLRVLEDNDINAVGVDINKAMISRARENGFKVVESDAYEYLRSQETGSVGGVVGVHIVEHIPFPQLVKLFDECYRVTTNGGMVAFETPNPENFLVGTNNFYMDPSHLHPLPPELLKFVAEHVGFTDVDILRINPYRSGQKHNELDEAHPLQDLLENRILGPLDYTVTAIK